METEYLNLVNKELHDIQQFFAHYYCSLDSSFSFPTTTTPSILLPAQRTLTVLPLLKLPLTPPTSHSQDTLRESNIDASFESSSTFYFSSSAPSSYSERDQYVSDLRDRYKQLKAVQDQMHLELTRARILRQSMLLPAVVTGGNEKENHVTCDDANPSSDSLQEGGGLSESTRQHEVSFTPTTLSVPAPESTPEPTTNTTTTTAPTNTPTPQIQPLFPDMRHLATKMYKSVPTRYILLALGLAVILGGLLDCDQDRLHNHKYDHGHSRHDHGGNIHKPVIQDTLHHPFHPQPPLEDILRYPWPRH